MTKRPNIKYFHSQDLSLSISQQKLRKEIACVISPFLEYFALNSNVVQDRPLIVVFRIKL